MKSVLDILFCDSLENDNALKGNKQYEKLFRKSRGLYEELDKELTEEQRDKLAQLWNADTGIENEASCAYFKEGFKTCMLMFAELNK